MRNKLSSNLGAAALLLVAILAASPAVAQDDDTESEDGFRFLIEIDAWSAQARGLEYEPATIADPSGTFGDDVIGFKPEAGSEPFYRFDLDGGKRVGHFRLTWFTQTQEQSMKEFQPGVFQYGQIQSHPFGAGWLNDGRSDGFESSTQTKLSDLRFDYSRTAFHSDRFEARWLIGIRRVQHERGLNTVYYTLAPIQDPLIPPVFTEPRPDLDPQPDRAAVSSDYRGRGLEAGMDFDVSLMKDRIKLETGFTVAVLSGRVDTSYSSSNWVYVFTDPETGEESILAPPYDFSEHLPFPPPDGSIVGDHTVQERADFRLSANSRSTISPVMDLYLGVRGRIWKGLEVVLGYRSVFYGNVGVDLRPKVASVTPSGQNFVDLTETERSAEYDGFYLGVAYTF